MPGLKRLDSLDLEGYIRDLFVVSSSKPRLTVIGGSRNLAPAGEISGESARALGALAEPGIKALEDVIHNDQAPRVIRESAVYGLGAKAEALNFNALARTLALEDSDVRFRALLTIRELIDGMSDVASEDAILLLKAVNELGLKNTLASNTSHIELEHIYHILSRQLPYAIERSLGEHLCFSDHEGVCIYAFHILARRSSSIPLLIKAFSRDDRASKIYGLIAGVLEDIHNSEIQSVAKAVIQHYPVARVFRYILSYPERNRRKEHVKLARKLLLV